jgi:hypothetical protein
MIICFGIQFPQKLAAPPGLEFGLPLFLQDPKGAGNKVADPRASQNYGELMTM